ncbi:Uncharacterised protein [Mycobacteroides abscessus subsp. abscessus]|nr:Uncharacterised protein [Mycobacteroides abscessus subsp. abscessus]
MSENTTELPGRCCTAEMFWWRRPAVSPLRNVTSTATSTTTSAIKANRPRARRRSRSATNIEKSFPSLRTRAPCDRPERSVDVW